jgi:hypothetical protein
MPPEWWDEDWRAKAGVEPLSMHPTVRSYEYTEDYETGECEITLDIENAIPCGAFEFDAGPIIELIPRHVHFTRLGPGVFTASWPVA